MNPLLQLASGASQALSEASRATYDCAPLITINGHLETASSLLSDLCDKLASESAQNTPPAISFVTLAASAHAELKLRKASYPKSIANGSMTADQARAELAAQCAISSHLSTLADQEVGQAQLLL
tara:strand:+ start:5256 stop:5630 length:375 start_codon:yes stop_codon:yes gene_type:complete